MSVSLPNGPIQVDIQYAHELDGSDSDHSVGSHRQHRRAPPKPAASAPLPRRAPPKPASSAPLEPPTQRRVPPKPAARVGGVFDTLKEKSEDALSYVKGKTSTAYTGEGGALIVVLAENVFGDLSTKDEVSQADIQEHIKELLFNKEELKSTKGAEKEKQVFAIDLMVSILRSAFHERYSFLRRGGTTIPKDIFDTWAAMHMACLTSPLRSCEGLRYTGK